MGVVDCHNMLMLLGGELRLSNHNLQDEYNGNGAKTIMKGDNTLMILWCYQFNYLWYSNHMFLGSVSKEMTVAERDVVIPLMMQVHKDANASCLKEANLRESFLLLFPSNTWAILREAFLNPKNLNLVIAKTCTKHTRKEENKKKGKGRVCYCISAKELASRAQFSLQSCWFNYV